MRPVDLARRMASIPGFPSAALSGERLVGLLLTSPIAYGYQQNTARTKLYILAAL